MGVRSIGVVPFNLFFFLICASLSTMLSVTWAFNKPLKRSSPGISWRTTIHKESPLQLRMTPKKKTATLTRSEEYDTTSEKSHSQQTDRVRNENVFPVLTLATTSTVMCLFVMSETANAAAGTLIRMPKELTQSFDPKSFVPVCGASDTFYRALQGTVQTVVGRENFIEYGPLIASGLLRIRLELCVVESFFNEAVGPFIQMNGLSWVLPVHETVETFLAGTVFALATTFILVGSTKILTVLLTYTDFFLGAPLRLFGGFIFDRARDKPVTLDIGLGPFKTRVIGPKDVEGEKNTKDNTYDYSVDLSGTKPEKLPVVILSGGVKAAGQSIGLLREILDAIDLFVGKSLILWATTYVGIKFIHFKIFPDFP